jgi:hypothetical protein
MARIATAARGASARAEVPAPFAPPAREARRMSARPAPSSIVDASALGVDGLWPAGQVLLVRSDARHLLALMCPPILGEALARLLRRVSPFGCPPPPSLIRAYSLPDAAFPSILLREHAEAPDGVGAAYLRFAGAARRHWLAALQETGSGLTPVVAWDSASGRRFLDRDALGALLDETGAALPGEADVYLGRALLLLAQPSLAGAWPTEMSLGGPTKPRRITGREFPVWVDLPAHESVLLGCPLLLRVEALLADG